MYRITVKTTDVKETWYAKQGSLEDIEECNKELMKRYVLGGGFEITMTYVTDDRVFEEGYIERFPLRDRIT